MSDAKRTLLGASGGGAATFALMAVAYLAPGLRADESVMSDDANHAPQAVQSQSEPPRDSQQADPSESCRQWFLEPFAALAGRTPQVSSTQHAGGRASDQVDSGISGELFDWEPQLMAARSAIETRFGPKPVDIEVLIATLPDPLDSGFGHQFDVQLQALQHGLESSVGQPDPTLWSSRGSEWDVGERVPASYNRSHSWLPWDDRIESGGQRKLAAECRKQVPGVMLFRSSNTNEPSVMVVLLVGETPTAGLHQSTMRVALDVELILRQGRHRKPTRILGPTFSGSALSLRHALLHRNCGPACAEVRVVSGSANGPDVPRLLTGTPADPPALRDVHFRTTTVPERRLVCSYLHFVKRVGAGDDDDDDARSGERRRPVDGVAILRELGTEFGSSSANDEQNRAQTEPECRLAPERYLAFPLHVSRIRDAYEEEDKRKPQNPGQEFGSARHTSLPVSLRERNSPLDLQSQQSPAKSTNAQDLALSHVLGAISREGIRHIGIEATDVGDAIFLARKIRDVAPDVRIAFFNADALQLHPSFRSDLMGALVVSPYPFLGAADFDEEIEHSDPGWSRRHEPFESDTAEATYNAALALRSAPVSALSEYDFIGGKHRRGEVALPIWISAIGRSALTPLAVRRTRDCNHIIYGRDASEATQAAVCGESGIPPVPGAFDTIRSMNLSLDRDVMPPRLWQFVFGTLILLAFVDIARMRGAASYFAGASIPRSVCRIDDRGLDLALSRLKWLQYSAMRSAVLTLLLGYMLLTTCFATQTYFMGVDYMSVALLSGLLVLGIAGTLNSAHYAIRAVVTCYVELAALRKLTCHWPNPHLEGILGNGSWLVRARSARYWLRSRLIGYRHRLTLEQLVYSSYARLRSSSLVKLALVTTIGFGSVLSLVQLHASASAGEYSTPSAVLFMLRNLSLYSGLSASTPLLLGLLCIYVASVGGMRRVQNAHALSRMTPDDGVSDGAATPISKIVFGGAPDGGFTYRERALTNPILRLNALSRYVVVIGASIALPLLVFLLKPPTALESRLDGKLLFVVLLICGGLVCTNLLQFYEHWRALASLLQLLELHQLASHFKDVLPFASQRLDAQISRPPNDLLTIAACSEELVIITGSGELALSRLGHEAGDFRRTCQEAMTLAAAQPTSQRATELEMAAGRMLINTASELHVMTRRLTESKQHTSYKKLAKRAERYVATVVALLVSRHLRQVSPFLWSTTMSVMLLLAAFQHIGILSLEFHVDKLSRPLL